MISNHLYILYWITQLQNWIITLTHPILTPCFLSNLFSFPSSFLYYYYYFWAVQPLLRSGPGSPGAGVLGHSLGTLGHCVLGQLPRQPQMLGRLDLPGSQCGSAEYWASQAPSPASRSNTSFTNEFMKLMALEEMPIWAAPASAPCRCTWSKFLCAGCDFWTSCTQDSCPAGPPATAAHTRRSSSCSSWRPILLLLLLLLA